MGIKICRNLSLQGVSNCKAAKVGTTFLGQPLLGKLVKTIRKTACGLWEQQHHLDSTIVKLNCDDVQFGLPDQLWFSVFRTL